MITNDQNLQRFVYDFRLLELKGDFSSQTGRSALEGLASKNIFELAIAQSRESDPPAELSGLLSASVNLNSKNISQQ